MKNRFHLCAKSNNGAYCVKKDSEVILTQQKRVLWSLRIPAMSRSRAWWHSLPSLALSHLTVPCSLGAPGSGNRDLNFSVAVDAWSHSIRQKGYNMEQSNSGILTLTGFLATLEQLQRQRTHHLHLQGVLGPGNLVFIKNLDQPQCNSYPLAHFSTFQKHRSKSNSFSMCHPIRCLNQPSYSTRSFFSGWISLHASNCSFHGWYRDIPALSSEFILTHRSPSSRVAWNQYSRCG